MKDGMTMGEADVERAEEVDYDRGLQEQRLQTMTRLNTAQIAANMAALPDGAMSRFFRFLRSLNAPCNTFAGIVLTICEEELVQRFLRSIQEGGGE